MCTHAHKCTRAHMKETHMHTEGFGGSDEPHHGVELNTLGFDQWL